MSKVEVKGLVYIVNVVVWSRSKVVPVGNCG